MAYLHNGRLYGRVNSDEVVCKQLRRLKDMKDKKGIEQRFYVGSLNIVKVKFGSMWWDYEKLAKHFPDMDIAKELVV